MGSVMTAKSKELPATAGAWIRDLPPLLLVGEAARTARVSPRTISRWIEDGLLRATKALRGKGSSKVLIPREALLAFLGLEG